MSYKATISFKSLKQSEIYPFFQKLKKTAINNIKEIANDEYLYMPSNRYDYKYKRIMTTSLFIANNIAQVAFTEV